MTQTRLSFEVQTEDVPAISSLVEDCFEEDAYPVAAFEVDEGLGIWSIATYVADEDVVDARKRLTDLMAGCNIPGTITEEKIQDENWVAKTLMELAPVRAGRFVVHGSHDKHSARPNEHAILIDAGMAFGTGHHGTTAGCLAMIDREIKRSRFYNPLDLGSGSGVLAIAVAKALQVKVMASDIDPVAAQIASQNARLNQVSGLIESITATGFHHRRFLERAPFDLIIANILAGPLQAMAMELACHLAPGATVILSGLLPHQKARILAAYRLQGLVLDHAHYQDGWMTLVLKNPVG